MGLMGPIRASNGGLSGILSGLTKSTDHPSNVRPKLESLVLPIYTAQPTIVAQDLKTEPRGSRAPNQWALCCLNSLTVPLAWLLINPYMIIYQLEIQKNPKVTLPLKEPL